MSFDCKKDITLEDGRAKMVHFDQLWEVARHHPKLVQYSPTPIETQTDLQEFLEKAVQYRNAGSHYPFAIWDKQANRLAGTTRFANISNRNRVAEIGWTWIGKDFQGTGLNKHMKFLMLRYAFEDLKFERVELKADAINLQSRRAMEKIGAQYEGLLRSHVVMRGGRRRDTVYYSIIHAEWTNVRAKHFEGLG